MTESYQHDCDLSHVSFESVDSNTAPVVDAWEGGKNTWTDGYVARKVVWPDGQMEICVTREKAFVGAALQRKARAKRGESENREQNDLDAGKAARKRVRQACKTISADRMVTLTYRENMQDREEALKDWKAFCRRLRGVMDFHYVAVMELQERGAIHFHVAVRGRQNYHLLRSLWYKVLGPSADGKTRGQVNVRNPHAFGFGKDGVHKLAAYIAKYCTKKLEVRDLDQKRYFCSRGIPEPDVISWRVFCDTQLEAVNLAVSIAMEGNLDGMVWWNNNALKCVWISTGPGTGSGAPVPF